MPHYRDKIRLSTSGYCDIHDITADVSGLLEKSGFNQGICCVAAVGSTAAVSTIEYEPGLLQDIPRLLESILPSGVPYEHDQTWGDGNGFSHLRSFLLKTSVTIPFNEGRLDLGTWQPRLGGVFLDFDNRSRSREIVVQLVGE
jgi:secondary thiamine-phosphate synthase enzyme